MLFVQSPVAQVFGGTQKHPPFHLSSELSPKKEKREL